MATRAYAKITALVWPVEPACTRAVIFAYARVAINYLFYYILITRYMSPNSSCFCNFWTFITILISTKCKVFQFLLVFKMDEIAIQKRDVEPNYAIPIIYFTPEF